MDEMSLPALYIADPSNGQITLARNSVQVNCPRCELFQFNTVPENSLRGGVIWREMGEMDSKTMAYSFMILKVTCRVKYKFLKGENLTSVLKLKLVDKDSGKEDALDLGELVGACDSVETREFEHELTSNKVLCGPGETGEVLCCCIDTAGGLFFVAQ